MPVAILRDERINLMRQVRSTNVMALEKVLRIIHTPHLNAKWKATSCDVLRERMLLAIKQVGSVL